MSYAVIKDWNEQGFDGFGGLVVAKVPKGPRAPRSAPVPRPDGTSSGMGCPKGQIMSDGGSCVAPPGGQKRKYDKSGGGGSASAGDFFPGPTGGGAPPPLPDPPQPVVPGAPPPFVPGSGGFHCTPPAFYHEGGCLTPGPQGQWQPPPGSGLSCPFSMMIQGGKCIPCASPYKLDGGRCLKTSTGGGGTTSGGSSVMENYLPPPPQPVIDGGSTGGGGSGKGGGKSGDPRGHYAGGASSGLVGGGSTRIGGGSVSAGTAFAPSSSGSGSGSSFAPAPTSSANGILAKFRQMMTVPSPTMTPLSPDPGWGPWQTKHAYEAAQSAFAAQTAAAMQPGSNITVVTHVPPPAERMTAPAAPVLATPSYVATGPTASAPLLQSAAFEPETKPFPWLLVAAVCAAGVGYYTYTKQNKRGRR